MSTVMRGRRGFLAGAALALAFPIVAFAAGEPGPAVITTKPVLGIASDCLGKVVAVGDTGSGMLVQRFGASGAAEPAIAGGDGSGRAVVVQNDGKIVVAGSSATGGIVRRFNTNGSVDTSFGSGGTAAAPGVVPNAIALGPSGTIVVGGSATAADGFSRVALARFLSTGAPDPSFGANGVAVVDRGRNSVAKGLAVQGDGKVVFAGQTVPGLQVVNAIIGRVNSNGTLDPGFANSGVFEYDHPGGGAASSFNGVTLDASGRIVAVGFDRRDVDSFALFVRLTSGGALDPSFGSGGFLSPAASVSYNGGDPVGPRSVAIAGGGEIVAAGSFQDSGLRSAALWALTPSGQLDGGVGAGGRVTTLPNPDGGDARAVTVAAGGSIFTAGDAINLGSVDRYNGFVGRYNGFGAPPASSIPTCSGTAAGAKVSAVSLSPRSLGSKTKAKLKFTLTSAASVKLTVDVPRSGRRQGRSCRAPSSRNRRGRRCTYYSRVASLTVRGKAGANSVTITRRFGRKTLAKGSYRLTVGATGGNSVAVTFRVV